MMAVIIVATIFIIERDQDDRPFGYVDHSGELSNASMPDDEKSSVDIIAFQDENSARAALEAEEIQGYHVLPEDYLKTLYADLYFLEEAPSTRVLRDFDDYVRANILDTSPTATQLRIIEGTTLTIQAMSEEREFQDNETGIIVIMLPLLIAMFFLFAVMGASGYFLQVVTDEKENRTMEIMITSVSPLQMIGGKSFGLVAVGLAQLTVWITSIAITWVVAQQFFEVLQFVKLPWDVLIVFAVFFLPSYAIVAGMMICIGSVVSELQEGQQISGILNLLFTFPIFFSALVFADPNSPLLIFLSLWPTTSLMSIIMRWGFTVVPIWQVALSWSICVTSSVGIIWLASRLFRLGMLRYGQRITFKTAFSALSPSNKN
jgi:ABC-2 type transport system permease protein